MTNELSYYQQRLSSLRRERQSFVAHWRDLSEHLSPRQSRFFVEDRNKGDRRNHKILNERGRLASRTLRSGLMSGVTNPARVWAALRTADPDLNQYQPVKIFLETLRDRMLEIFLRSNLYTTLPTVYGDLGDYGTTAYFAPEDPQSLIRCYHYPIGSYMLATDNRGRMDTCYREFSLTARQTIAQFGKSNVSGATQKLADQPAGKETWVPLVHAIEPNPHYDPGKDHFAAYKKFHSCYFEIGADKDKKLHTGGFDTFPVLAPRWDVTGEDIYATSCPGMDSLGSNRQLQLREKRKGQLIDKGVSPPMKGPASLKDKRSSILSGDMTYIDAAVNGTNFEPVYKPEPAYYQWVLEDIAALENRISRTYFEDLFLMLANDTRSNITAREIAERHEEKLLQIGPVLLRQNDEHFDPLFDLMFSYMARNRLLPPVPPEMRSMDLNVEYISILSQAMKMAGAGSLERGVGFVGGMLQAWPDIRHCLDPYAAVSEYFGVIGASPKVLNDKPTYEAKIDAEQKQLQAQQMAAMVTPAAGALKTLADAKLDEGESALGRISQMAGLAG